MSWIALKMLVGDRAKFYGIVLGLTFAALLICQQGSIFCGLMLRTCGQISDITGADLWVMDASVRYIDDVKPMIQNNLYRVRGVEGVRWAVPLYKGNARAKLNTINAKKERITVIDQVILLGLDDASLVGAPPPERILVGDLSRLRKPDAVIIDKVRLPKLYFGDPWDELAKIKDPQRKNAWYERFIGREMEMNDHRAVIVGICEATRTFQSNPVVYTTYSRALQYAPQERKVLSYILAKTEPGIPPSQVAERIRSQTGLGALSSSQFMWKTIFYYMAYTGIPVNFGITAMLGFFVGTAIAGQTFYNFTLENLKQFGALKAMGATNLRIVQMILLQATVVGLLGYGIGMGLAVYFGWNNQSPTSDLTYFIPRSVLRALDPQAVGPDAGEALRLTLRETIDGLLPRPADVAPASRSCERIIRTIADIGAAPSLALLATAVLFLLFVVRVLKWRSFLRAVAIVAIGSLLAAALAYYFFKQGVKGTELAFYTWWPIPLITGCAVVLICILASLLSIRRVIVLEPAVVFRG